MNWKALRKALTFSPKNALIILAAICGTVAFIGLLSAFAVGLSYVLIYLFGEHVGNIIILIIGFALPVFVGFIQPIIDRYNRAKRELAKSGE